jgi:hypothetical protein
MASRPINTQTLLKMMGGAGKAFARIDCPSRERCRCSEECELWALEDVNFGL